MLCDVQWLQGSYCTVYCTAGGAASFTSSLQKLSLCGLSHPHIAQSMIPWCPRVCLVAESIMWAAMEVCQHQPFSPECKETNKANRICSTCQKRAPSIDEKSIKIQAVGQSTLCRSSCLSHRNTVLKKTAFLLKVAGGAATQKNYLTPLLWRGGKSYLRLGMTAWLFSHHFYWRPLEFAHVRV